MRILICTADVVSRNMAVRLVTTLGHEAIEAGAVEPASSGYASLFDMLIMDSDQDGGALSLAADARAHGFCGPILLMAENLLPHDRLAAAGMKITHLLEKPLDMRQFCEAMNTAVASYAVNPALPATRLAPAPVTPDGQSLLNLEEVRERFNDNEELLREVLAMYLVDAPARISAMEAGIGRNDIDKVVRAAHSLKGISASVGSQRLAEAAWHMERTTKSGNLLAASALSLHLRDLLSQTLHAVEQGLKSL